MKVIFKGNLTPHFTIDEYAVGNTDDVHLTEDAYTFALILEHTRVDAGLRFYVNSWCRSYKLNKAVGGVSSSNHLRGCACDFHLTNKVTRARFIKIVKIFKRWCREYGVVGEAGIYSNFIHLGIQSPTQIAINNNKFIQWDGRKAGPLIFNNIREVLD